MRFCDCGYASSDKRTACCKCGKPFEPNKVELVSHEVIENQLLNFLNDKSKVAILATEEDLDVLIAALALVSQFGITAHSSKAKELRAGLRQLHREAFPGGYEAMRHRNATPPKPSTT